MLIPLEREQGRICFFGLGASDFFCRREIAPASISTVLENREQLKLWTASFLGTPRQIPKISKTGSS
jgi:hypothetical protein